MDGTKTNIIGSFLDARASTKATMEFGDAVARASNMKQLSNINLDGLAIQYQGVSTAALQASKNLQINLTNKKAFFII